MPACPPVSVILPLYNVRPFLAEAVASLTAQNWPELEVIAVDDGSTDGSAEEMARLWPAAKIITQANQGPAAARNHGLAAATSPLVAFLDGDDLWPAGKLARQVARLTSEPELWATMGFIKLFSDTNEGRAWGQPYFLFLLGGMLARRNLMLAPPDGIGAFDAVNHPFQGEDTDWFFRVWESGRPVEIQNSPELFYRRRPGSLTAAADDTMRAFPALLQGSLRRRRGPDGRTQPLPNSLRLPKMPVAPR